VATPLSGVVDGPTISVQKLEKFLWVLHKMQASEAGSLALIGDGIIMGHGWSSTVSLSTGSTSSAEGYRGR